MVINVIKGTEMIWLKGRSWRWDDLRHGGQGGSTLWVTLDLRSEGWKETRVTSKGKRVPASRKGRVKASEQQQAWPDIGGHVATEWWEEHARWGPREQKPARGRGHGAGGASLSSRFCSKSKGSLLNRGATCVSLCQRSRCSSLENELEGVPECWLGDEREGYVSHPCRRWWRGRGGGEKWMDLRAILELKPIVLANGLGVGMRKRAYLCPSISLSVVETLLGEFGSAS